MSLIGLSQLLSGAVIGLAAVAQARDRPLHAAGLLGAGDAALARIGSEMPWPDNSPRDRLEKALRSELGDKAYDELHAEGGRLEPDEAVAGYETLAGQDEPEVGA